MSDSKALTVAGTSVRQVNGLYSLNDLHKASGEELRHRPVEFIRLNQTQDLIGELEKGGDPHLFLNTVKGRNGGTYACKELVIAYAAWISAAFHLKVIRVFLAVTVAQPIQQALPLDSELRDAMSQLSRQVAQLTKSKQPEGSLLPAAQSKEITDRLERLGKMFHPFSDQFLDVLGVTRALRGLDPKMSTREPGFKQVIQEVVA